MDAQRFDAFARLLAGRGSRRRLLRALVGGTALLTAVRRWPSIAVAHHGSAGPGDACRTDSQCVAADAPMVCAWNGYGSAGAACCTYEGSNCADDSWCCNTNLCIGGICTDPNALAGDPGATDSGLNQTGYGFPPGQACISDSQCDNSYPELGIANLVGIVTATGINFSMSRWLVFSHRAVARDPSALVRDAALAEPSAAP